MIQIHLFQRAIWAFFTAWLNARLSCSTGSLDVNESIWLKSFRISYGRNASLGTHIRKKGEERRGEKGERERRRRREGENKREKNEVKRKKKKEKKKKEKENRRQFSFFLLRKGWPFSSAFLLPPPPSSMNTH